MHNKNLTIKASLILLLVICLLFGQASNFPVSAQVELPIYIVQANDTLSTIAIRFNVTTQDIIDANEMINPDFLRIGDEIRIPGLDGISGILTTQVVPFGVNLTSLSRQNGIDTASLVKLNKYTSPAEAFAGVKMIIPVQDQEKELTSISMPADMSLLELAAIHNTNVWTLRENNAVDSTALLLPNELIYILDNIEDETNLALPSIRQIEINTLPLIQGSTIVVKIKSDAPVSIDAEILDRKLHFFSETPNEYIALYGVSALANPGAYPFNIIITDENGESYAFEQWVLLQAAGFGYDPVIYVPEESVDPDVIAAEEEIYENYISTYTPTRYWDGIFGAPGTDRTCIVGYYGNRRSYNDGALLYYHTGIDYGYCEGIEVYAPASGVVAASEENLAIRGNAIILDHGWGVFTGYWHLNEILVKPGDIVETGQLIGYLGNTGRSAGPHLHFEMIVNGVPVNPETWLNKEFP